MHIFENLFQSNIFELIHVKTQYQITEYSQPPLTSFFTNFIHNLRGIIENVKAT